MPSGGRPTDARYFFGVAVDLRVAVGVTVGVAVGWLKPGMLVGSLMRAAPSRAAMAAPMGISAIRIIVSASTITLRTGAGRRKRRGRGSGRLVGVTAVCLPVTAI